MSILNVAGYRFVDLTELSVLQATLRAAGEAAALRGTILLSPEGINLMLAGEPASLTRFLDEVILADSRFAGMDFRRSLSVTRPFDRFKVKIRREIITMRHPEADPVARQAPSLTPAELARWLDEGRPVRLLDTRNDFEVQVGAFEGAIDLGLKDFSEFPAAMASVPRDLPIVMYCTGGIRCEKASLAMLDAGFRDVYQLEGGILGYFAEVGGAHYKGDCFVFDQRVALDTSLQPVS